MAEQFTGDFHIVGTVDGGEATSREFAVVAGAASSIAKGDLVVIDAGNAGYVAKGANGASNSVRWLGMAKSDSTDTVGADGVVDVAYHPSGLIVRGVPTTAGNLAQGIFNTLVTLDVTTGVQTVDENDTANGVLSVWDYNTDDSTIDVVVPFHIPWVLSS